MSAATATGKFQPVALGLCWCGMEAVGKCTECEEVLCGDHIARRHSRVLCQTHMDLAEIEQATRQQAQVEERRKAAALS
jgi:hypothetical protein